jgi:hypothetical protein
VQAIRWAIAALDESESREETLEALELIERVVDRSEARPMPPGGSSDQD